MVLPFFFPRYPDSVIRASGRGEEPSRENVFRLILDPSLMMVGFVLWIYETSVLRFCACAVSLRSPVNI